MFRAVSVLICAVMLSLTVSVFAVGQAASPDPANSTSGVVINKVLQWMPGDGDVSHDVYLGTTFNEVNTAARMVGDLNGDRVVDSNDLLLLIEYWLANPNSSEPYAGVNDDNTVDFADFALMSQNWSDSSSVFKGNQDSNSFDPGTLAISTTYYWRVDEVNSSSIAKGSVWSFTTEPAGKATNPSPIHVASGVATTPTLTWTAGSGAVSHTVYFGTAEPLTLMSNQPGTSYNPGTLVAGTIYYWRIDEVNSVGGVKTGDTWFFVTAGTNVGYVNWHATDAGPNIQNKLQGSSNIVIVQNMGSPWQVGKMTLTSSVNNKTFILEPGVVIEAKSGSFTGTSDSVFLFKGVNNFKFLGAGSALSTVKMRKWDYTQAPYAAGQWRMCIDLRACRNFTIQGLTARESGGDGVYLAGSHGLSGIPAGYVHCQDIILNDVVCDDNYRQGMSIIDVNGLTVTNCVFKNTIGTAPEMGVDIEPNTGSNVIMDMLFDNCQFLNNHGGGFHLATYHYRSTYYASPGLPNAIPADINFTVQNCVSSGNGITNDAGNRYGAGYGFDSLFNNGPVNTTIVLKNCVATECDGAGLYFHNFKESGSMMKVDNCTFGPNVARTQALGALLDTNPIGICDETGTGNVSSLGGLNFINGTKVIDNKNRSALKVLRYGVQMNNVTGNLAIQNPSLAIPTLKLDFGGSSNLVNVTLTTTSVP